jgi:predicted transcriptional regulator of viral defense system
MSTGYKNSVSERFALVARMGETVFHTRDLANLWRIKDNNTLHTTLKRYAQRGLLFRIYKGFYALVPASEIDSRLLGVKALHEYAYISTETILAEVGIISQKIEWITLVGSRSKKFFVGDRSFLSRKLADRFLFNPIGIQKKGEVNTALPERAVADLLYFNPDAYLDGASLVDWKKVRALQKKIGYPLTPKYYDSPKSKRRGA